MTIFKENIGYSAYTNIGNKFIGTEGDDFEELRDNILDAVNLSFEEDGFIYDSTKINYSPEGEKAC